MCHLAQQSIYLPADVCLEFGAAHREHRKAWSISLSRIFLTAQMNLSTIIPEHHLLLYPYLCRHAAYMSIFPAVRALCEWFALNALGTPIDSLQLLPDVSFSPSPGDRKHCTEFSLSYAVGIVNCGFAILVDAVTLLLTWLKTAEIRKTLLLNKLKSPLTTMLLRDGKQQVRSWSYWLGHLRKSLRYPVFLVCLLTFLLQARLWVTLYWSSCFKSHACPQYHQCSGCSVSGRWYAQFLNFHY